MTQEQTATASAHDGVQRSRCSGTTSTAPSATSRAGGTFESLQPGDERGHRAGGRRPGGGRRPRRRRRSPAFDEGPWPRLTASERAGCCAGSRALISEPPTSSSSVEVLDIGMPIAQMRGLAARAAAELRLLRGRRHRAARPLVPGRRRVPQLHDPQAGRRGRADHAVERAADALDLAHRAGARRRQHDRAQAGRVVAVCRRRCSAGARGGRPARAASSTSSTASARPPARRSRPTRAST